MIIWTIKLISNVRKAIAGRKYPHQLAWAVAFGLLLGVVPHGNLLALAILLVVLSLKINHAMAAITAVGTTFAATKLDPYSHQVGEYVLTHPQLAESASNIWQLPLVPWTDLNNTVVLGSVLIGVAALIPVFLITYPVFRFFAPKPEADSPEPNPSRRVDIPGHEVIVVDQGHKQIARPHRVDPPQTLPQRSTVAAHDSQVHRIDSPNEDQDSHDESEHKIAVETRIDVIRMKDYRDATSTAGQAASSGDPGTDDQRPMDEALNYLLRQLRDSQQRKAA